MVEAPTGEAHKAGVFCCTVGSFGADGAAMAMMTPQAGEIMNAFLKGCRWKFTHKYHELLISIPVLRVNAGTMCTCARKAETTTVQ